MYRLLFAVLFCLAISMAAKPGIAVPEGYVLQVLGGTDGRIAMPKAWHYTNGGTETGWLWTFSAEEMKDGQYETGLRIQMIMDVERRTNQSKDAFAKNFIEQKRKSLKVIKECPVEDFGTFKRQCIEVLESIQSPSGVRRFHILYSVMWLQQMDVVAVSTFGAPEDEWDSVADISKIMSEFVLIGENPGNSN
jgi:hypothetical protein